MTAGATQMDLVDIGGVFIVLIIGSLIAFIIAVFEFVWKSRKLASESVDADGRKGSVWKIMMSELKANFNCSRETKPARPRVIDNGETQ